MDKHKKTSWTLSEILDTDFGDPEDAEEEYRRGYMDGFYAGFAGYDDLLIAGVSKKNAYNRCWDFWQRKLTTWVNGDCDKFELPPSLDVSK